MDSNVMWPLSHMNMDSNVAWPLTSWHYEKFHHATGDKGVAWSRANSSRDHGQWHHVTMVTGKWHQVNLKVTSWDRDNGQRRHVTMDSDRTSERAQNDGILWVIEQTMILLYTNHNRLHFIRANVNQFFYLIKNSFSWTMIIFIKLGAKIW